MYPSSHSYTRWLERLLDGVIRLEPFPHSFSADAVVMDEASDSEGRAGKKEEEIKLQGMLTVRKLPLLTERGYGGGEAEDMAWALGRKRFVIRRFNLPPVELDDGGGGEQAKEEKRKAKDLEF